MNKTSIKELLLKIADDELILGHRNSEWTGLGPILEEDIAFSSMAQDKIGHALALYTILHEEFGEPEPNRVVFGRNVKAFKCCHLVEMPNEEYDFSLIRHFFFDHAEFCRYLMLENSSFSRLSDLAKKIKGELKYHVMHADIWIKKLGNSSEEARIRLQTSIDHMFPMVLGIFEPGEFEDTLIKDGIFEGEKALQKKWLKDITPVLKVANLKLPNIDTDPKLGGRQGKHTEHLSALLEEMTEVYRTDPAAEW